MIRGGLVQTPEKVIELFNYVKSHDLLSLDTETTSLNPRSGKIIGLSLSGEPGTGYYLPIYNYIPTTDTLDLLFIRTISCTTVAKELLKILKTKKLVTHNGSFDLRFIKNFFEIDLIDSLYADTQLLVHTVQEEGAEGTFDKPFGLKEIAVSIQEELGLDIQKAANQEQIDLKENIKKNGGSTTKDNFEIYKADMDKLSEYAVADADLTLRIFLYFLEKLKKEHLEDFFFEQEVMPLYKEVTIPMEERGVKLDLDLIRKTDEKIQEDLKKCEEEVVGALLEIPDVKNWIIDKALKKFPPSVRGKWAERFLLSKGVNHPCQKKYYDLFPEDIKSFFVNKTFPLTQEIIDVSLDLWREQEGNWINIQSRSQLGDIFFNILEERPLTTTAKGKPQFDEDTILAFTSKYDWIKKLRVYNKLLKIKSTYIDRFLNEKDGDRYFFYFKQYGTVSGRYGSNAQQLPKPKEENDDEPIVVNYNNLVRAFLISDPGYIFIDCDYESLEPRVFASVTEDENLQEIFRKNYDFYSYIAIKTEKIENVSADKSADNFLKKLHPTVRNKAKAYSLGMAYGMEDYALSKTINVSREEAKILVKGYLDSFPGLKNWIDTSRKFVKENGYIKNRLGRIRHLPRVKLIYDKLKDSLLDWRQRAFLEKELGTEDTLSLYRDYKNGLNNTLNFQIQSLAAGVVNRAAIAITRAFKEAKIDGWVSAQVHDQLIFSVLEEDKLRASSIVQHLMENTTTLFGVELEAPPSFAYNFRDGH